MENRRSFIKTLTSSAVALAFAPWVPARAAAAAPAERFFVVDGWVLTRADLAALKIDAS